MAAYQVTTNQSSSLTNPGYDVVTKTTETVTSTTAGLSGAFAGSLSVGGSASSKTITETSSGSQMSKAEADKLYEERIEDEYAKREGGA
jgi:uncharacterized protein YjdB